MHLGFFIDVENMPVLIIGGGKVASRKTKKLLAAGASVTAVSPIFLESFPAEAHRITSKVDAENFLAYIEQFRPRIVVLATTDRVLHPKLVALCKQHTLLVNDSQNGFTQFAFANTTTVGHSLISYFSHGDMHATRKLKHKIDQFIDSFIKE